MNTEDSEVGLLGLWNGPLGQTKVGVVMNNDSLQMFSLKRYGFVPDTLLENTKDCWTLEHAVANYHYEEFGSRVLLTLKIMMNRMFYQIIV